MTNLIKPTLWLNQADRSFDYREFDAPREHFKAFTDPELYVQWLGPRDLTMTLKRLNQRAVGRGAISTRIKGQCLCFKN
jgi:hypothetical protein